MSKNQSPYMISTAYEYLRAAKILWLQPNLSSVSNTNAAIGIEILLKSFFASPVDNARKGTFGEQYEINGRRIHSLSDLAEKIDKDLASKLGFYQAKDWFKLFDNLFLESRYPYEKNAPNSYSEAPVDLGIKLLNNTIKGTKKIPA